MFRLFRRKKRLTFSEAFRQTAREHGLEGKVELREDWWPPENRFTFFRIIEREEERSQPLSEDLVQKVRDLIIGYFAKETRQILGTDPVFIVGPGKTVEEIKAAQRAWAHHCDLLWEAAGG